ncbi:ABC transporter ATP-binding protein [Enterococcus xiangfangensis]|uniref:ABC transporter ATP-binding protein n=1 Tax=Enterococcus xiangfangensis TaxID=1296537 RepID=UPI001EF8C75D|nr:ABC transporter ATP-binding protein [Enterococcus xiangfangensis]MBM7710748.1 ABC-2 type transport system ATP-binding protein [Enterococcus xiangfangensis]
MNTFQTKPMITIDHAKKQFGKVSVLKDISMTIQKGEIYTLLGENGAGKTTLIKMMTTLLQPDSGEITIAGRSVTKQPNEVRELISLNSQEATVDMFFSGYENLRLIARLRGVKNEKAEIQQLAKRLGLEEFIDRRVAEYSGGMRRRLDIAMSLVGDPEILFLDEPTTGVDPKNRLEIWRIIREISDAGKTIFLTTQYLDEADRLSDHISFLHKGEIVLTGTPEELKKNTNKKVKITLETEQHEQGKALLTQAGISFEDNEGLIINDEDQQQTLELFVANQLTIVALIAEEVSLETIFLMITKEQNK